jgi:xanthine dehydrogenase small subunit
MKKKDIISFVLDGEVRSVNFRENGLKPSTTVLNYLRSLPDHKGVKEGCGEGDCGACTVVIAEPGNGGLKYSAINSCLLFLPMIHGKQLITIENIAETKNNKNILHPVQEAMIRLNGSQCGYCTPGMVMSLFALYKNHDHPSRQVAEDALAGNLCRCTGYQPILDAALQACTQHGKDHFSSQETEVGKKLDQIQSENPSLQIKTETCEYFRPAKLREALSLRRKHPDAIVINGATDTALRQTKRYERLPYILDLSAISELKFFRKKKDGFHIGAGSSMEDLKNNCKKDLPALYEMLSVFASQQIRQLATIGGNVATASPIGDALPVLFAYKAKVLLSGTSGKREVAIEEFIKGYRKTALQKDELIYSVIIPKPEKDSFIRSYKVSKRKDVDISTVSAGFSLKLNSENIIENIILAYGGMSSFTKRASATESFLCGQKWTRETIKSVMEIIQNDFTPISDARAGKEFRMMIAQNMLMKFFLETS